MRIPASVVMGLVTGIAVAAAPAQADYPERTINVMIPFSAGGGTDVPGRLFAQEMEKILGANIVVSNVQGAGGTIGATQLSKAKPDGYNLGFMPVGTTTTQPHIRKTAYNDKSWEPICLVSQSAQYVFVPEDSPYKTIQELAEGAKTETVITGGPPPGSLHHLGQLAVAKSLGVEFKYIPHQGINQVAKSMLGGRVHMTTFFADAAERFNFRPLAVLASERSSNFPDVPTLAEVGEPAVSVVWFGFFAPAGVPDEVAGKLSSACGEAVAKPSFVEAMAKVKRPIHYLSRDEFAAFFAEQYQQNGELLREAGLVK